MASTVCNQFTKNIASRKCLTAGGIKTRAWVFQAEDFTGMKTFNAGGALSSFTLATGAAVITCTGRPKQGSGASAIDKPIDGGVSVGQTVVLQVSYNTPAEAKAIMDFFRADGKTVFLETNAGTIRQYFAEFGDETAKGEEGTGKELKDASNVVTITLTGTESDLPLFFEAIIQGQMTQLASSRAYLDALVTGTAVA